MDSNDIKMLHELQYRAARETKLIDKDFYEKLAKRFEELLKELNNDR